MSELGDRLRREARQLRVEIGYSYLPGVIEEAAAELERLESIVGEASNYTDSHWGARLASDHGVAAAAGYWERHLAVTGPAMRSAKFSRL